MTESQVTVGFKVPASEKLKIERAAKNLGLSTSDYLRGIVNKDSKKLSFLSDYPEEFLFSQNDRKTILNLIEQLPNKYNKDSIPDMFIATLKLSIFQQKQFIDTKLSKFLNPKTQ